MMKRMHPDIAGFVLRIPPSLAGEIEPYLSGVDFPCTIEIDETIKETQGEGGVVLTEIGLDPDEER